MSIENYLLPRKKILVQSWFDLLLGSYPSETARTLKREINEFANPVGHTFKAAIGELADEFLADNRPDRIFPLLDRIIRIRAVQDFAPSGAIGFVFFLKNVARDLLRTEIEQGAVSSDDLARFDLKVDRLVLAAMDVYARCRENLYEIKIREIKNRTQRLLLRAQIIADVAPEESGEDRH